MEPKPHAPHRWKNRAGTGTVIAVAVLLAAVATVLVNRATDVHDEQTTTVAAEARGKLSGRIDTIEHRMDALSARLNALAGDADPDAEETELRQDASGLNESAGVTQPQPGGHDNGYIGQFATTCYQLRGTTSDGTEAGPGIVAVDPDVIPLGAVLYLDGIGRVEAHDTGPGVQGRHIDVWRASCDGYTNPTVGVTRLA